MLASNEASASHVLAAFHWVGDAVGREFDGVERGGYTTLKDDVMTLVNPKPKFRCDAIRDLFSVVR